jgi:hypothetical protein
MSDTAMERAIEFATKYALVVFIAIAFVLFVPKEAADQIGISDVRSKNLGYLWIGLVVTGLLWVGSAFRYLDAKAEGFFARRRAARKELDRLARLDDTLRLRISSLNADEIMWIKYCLYYEQQTLSAERTRPVAQSLVHKGILREGSGHILDLPFHVPDEVWLYLLRHRDDLLPESERSDPRLERVLEEFKRSLHWRN